MRCFEAFDEILLHTTDEIVHPQKRIILRRNEEKREIEGGQPRFFFI